MRSVRASPDLPGSRERPTKAQVIDNRMSPRVHIDCEFPPELVEVVAERAAELLASRVEAADHWMTTTEAANYLRCPLSRVYALTSASRIPFHRDGSRLLFRRSELDVWVKQGGARRPG